MAWILWIWKYRKLAGIAAVALVLTAGLFYVRHVIEKNDKLEKQVEQLQLDLKTERENHEKVVKALEGKARDAEERSKFKEKSAKEIEKDRKKGDGPMAPVLRNTIDRLRARQAALGTPG